MEDRPLREDEYPDAEHELPPRGPRELDAIDTAVGSGAYVYRFTLQECVERFPHSLVARWPERFDRFYFSAEGGPLLVDIVEDATEEQRERSLASKHVAFKERWCAENDRRYLVLGESESTDLHRVRVLLNPPDAPPVEKAKRSEATNRPVAQPARRGKVQRPKAAV